MTRQSLAAVVNRIRLDSGLTTQVPDFDPKNGNEAARFLFVLEAPGPKAIRTGFVSFDNPDQTAKNLRDQLEQAGVNRSDIALWNVVPWYLGNDTQTKIRGAMSSDVKKGLQYLTSVVQCMPNLECIILVGGAARKAHIHLSRHTRARIVSCHHPSPKVQNTVSGAREENVAVFRFMLTEGV
jgi:uracil-DNA glycosylase